MSGEASKRLDQVRAQFRRSVGDIAGRYLRATAFIYTDEDRVIALEDMRKQFNEVIDFLVKPSRTELIRENRQRASEKRANGNE